MPRMQTLTESINHKMKTVKHPMIFIPGNVPSSKNLQRCGCTKQAKPYEYADNRVKEYIQLTDDRYAKMAEKFYKGYENGHDLLGEKMYSAPCKVGFHFVRADKRDFDFINALQIVADRMVHHGWLTDDSMRYFIPTPLYYTPKEFTFNCGWYSVNPNGPGVAIKLLG